MVTGTMNINTDPNCGKAMDPDMGLGSSSSSDDFMALGDSPGLS